MQAAVDVFGPAEAASLVQFWQARVAAGDPNSAEYRELIARVVAATGGPPASVPAAYACPSRSSFVPELDAWPGALLLVDGTDDALVPHAQSCLLASSMRDVRAYYRDALRPLPGPPPGCTAPGLPWLTGDLPAPRWPDRRYLMVYRGALPRPRQLGGRGDAGRRAGLPGRPGDLDGSVHGSSSIALTRSRTRRAVFGSRKVAFSTPPGTLNVWSRPRRSGRRVSASATNRVALSGSTNAPRE